jgi:hypothetical protein
MKTDYSDIVAQAGAPKWWDENGAPRYADFHPCQCGVYVQAVALVRIACQACGHEFVVASVEHRHQRSIARVPDRDARDPWDAVGSFHYGDPPRGDHAHAGGDCVGDTMNSVPLEVVEFWRQGQDFNWGRCPEYEFHMPQLQG